MTENPAKLQDLFDTPALRVLRAMTTEPLTMKTFTYLSGQSSARAKVLRERLEALGLVTVTDAPLDRRTTTDLEISATPQGAQVAQHSARILQIVATPRQHAELIQTVEEARVREARIRLPVSTEAHDGRGSLPLSLGQ